MIIDSHQHVFWHDRDDKGLVADMDEQGIDVAWLLTWEIPAREDNPSYHGVLNPLHVRTDGTHKGIPFADVLIARDRYPDRFVLGYCPDPMLNKAPDLFEAAFRMHGVRVCGEWKFQIPIDDPRCIELFRKAGELGCPVIFHVDVPYLPDENGKICYQTFWYGGTAENLERALRACPETVFLGHAPGFWREISGDADTDPNAYPAGPVTPGGRLGPLLDKCSNLRLDLSAGSGLNALKRDPDHAREFLARYCDRAQFGRDYYGGDLHEFLQSLDLSEEIEEKIYFRNALKLVDLDENREGGKGTN